ncbi:MAG: nickel pincer cofactor biosynthesis protein LarC [Acidobacteriota bacterium]|nr:nickel pincer cofactor biosynthesis protein LarC [Acidobacteriota bacterium]
MARTLYLDCFAGASGDMFIGALLDCGLDFEFLKSELAKLGVEDYELSLERVDRSGISAAKFDVHLAHSHNHEPPPDHSHPHSHDHGHSHEHRQHEHSHEHQNPQSAIHSPQSHGHRSLSTIKQMISASALSATVKERAQAIFQRIGEAESKIHGIPIETVHFHEVGAIDSIVDIIGACVGLEALKIKQIISSPLHVGSGTFNCAHGTYPVPGPATAEILKGVPIYAKEIEGELVTPTGAAIIATLTHSYGNLPAMRVERVGYGAGTRTYPKFPNVLRAIIGEVEPGSAGILPVSSDDTPTTVTVIEANIDDLNAQVFGHLMEKALQAGALDIFYTPVQMKKNRPGVLVTLLCRPEDRMRMSELLFRETTTLGVRYREERREILRREHIAVETAFGQIRIKVARDASSQAINYTPEFEDCRRAAELHQTPIREIQAAAMRAYAESPSSDLP